MIKHEYPPNLAQIETAFGPVGPTVIFTYAPHIYVPNGDRLSKPLIAHEEVHLRQQCDDPEMWWERYLADPEFRFQEELEAHRAEWATARRIIRDRNRSARILTAIARRLASPLYGSLVSFREAKAAIEERVH